MSIEKLKRFDVYRDIPKDLTEQTLSGGIVSLIAMFIMSTLILSEFIAYLSITTKHEMFVDAPRDTENEHAMFQINMNITVPAMPCAITSVDAQDVMGSHVVDVGGKLHKTRTDSYGNIKYINGVPLQGDTTDNPVEQVGEGCNIHGNMIVKMVPGNFHISAHAHANLLHLFVQGTNMNCTHFVHDLTFGEGTELFQNVAKAQGNPLKGSRRIALPDPTDPEISKSYEYYIRVVPTQYQSSNGRIYDSFQYVANSNQMDGKYRLPAIYFRYELSPITVKFTQQRESFTHFIVQLCAIVGGVFTVLGLINNMVSSSLKTFKKKAELNKLG